MDEYYAALAAVMPCDETVLVELGRVNWAAARLHAYVRDAINAIDGAPSDAPFLDTLGQVIAGLQRRAERLASPDREALVAWCTTIGRPAKDARNKVIHAVTFTADDGRQAMMTADHSEPGRYLVPELLRVTGQLVHAQLQLPSPPYMGLP